MLQDFSFLEVRIFLVDYIISLLVNYAKHALVDYLDYASSWKQELISLKDNLNDKDKSNKEV